MRLHVMRNYTIHCVEYIPIRMVLHFQLTNNPLSFSSDICLSVSTLHAIRFCSISLALPEEERHKSVLPVRLAISILVATQRF